MRKKIRPPKLAEYDFKYAKIVVDTRGGLNRFYIEAKPDSAGDSTWYQRDLLLEHERSIYSAVEEFDRFRVHNATGCISEPFNREWLMKSEQAETVRRLVSNAYLELNGRSFSVMDSLVSLMRGVSSGRCLPVNGGFIFYNWMPSSWIPSSTDCPPVSSLLDTHFL